MSASTVALHVAHREVAPRGAQALGALFASGLHLVSGLGAGVAALFHREPSRYEAAEAVMRLARQHEHCQPGFASDLRVAALRHRDGGF